MGELFATFGINSKLLIIQAVNFGLLLLLLWYFLYRPILKIIDERREKIADGVRLAEAADTKLADAEAEGKQMVADAAKEAEGLVANARSRAGEKETEIIHAAEMRADTLLKDAAQRAEEAQKQALQSSEKDIARAAMLAAEKILREKSA